MNAVTLLLLLSAATPDVIERWHTTNHECRGGTGEEAFAWCEVREGYDKVLQLRGWCYEGEPFPEWRKCVKG